MTTKAEYRAQAEAIGRQADRYDAIATSLYGFGDRARETQEGPFLGPLEASISRGLGDLVSAATSLRSVAAACLIRADLILQHEIDVQIWEFENRDVLPFDRPRPPQWTHDWSNR